MTTGQKIICVDASSAEQYLKPNKIYTIKQSETCSNCGCESISLTQIARVALSEHICDCGRTIKIATNDLFFKMSRFKTFSSLDSETIGKINIEISDINGVLDEISMKGIDKIEPSSIEMLTTYSVQQQLTLI